MQIFKNTETLASYIITLASREMGLNVAVLQCEGNDFLPINRILFKNFFFKNS